MMTEKVEKNKCTFNGDVVAYIYNEMRASDRERYDDHLQKCGPCIDELASLSHAAFSLREWKELEFAPMSSPIIDVPRPVDASTNSSSGWLIGLRELFQVPRMVAAGFSAAALVGVLVLAGLVYELRGPVDVAVLENGNLPAASPERSVAASRNDDGVKTSVETVVKDFVQTTQSDTGIPVQPNVTSLKPEPAKDVRTSSRPTDRRTNSNRSNRGSDTTITRSPRLLDYEEVQDDSLRLADLLEDIETSD